MPQEIVTTLFYTFAQNNSGGSFYCDPEAGIGYRVVVEAVDERHANALAIGIGLYFDGCESGLDCRCCGDRWHEVDKSDGKPMPMQYGEPIKGGWGIPSYIHRIGGQIEEIAPE